MSKVSALPDKERGRGVFRAREHYELHHGRDQQQQQHSAHLRLLLHPSRLAGWQGGCSSNIRRLTWRVVNSRSTIYGHHQQSYKLVTCNPRPPSSMLSTSQPRQQWSSQPNQRLLRINDPAALLLPWNDWESQSIKFWQMKFNKFQRSYLWRTSSILFLPLFSYTYKLYW